MDLDLGLIRTFSLIAETRSFSQAANLLGLSQQALSKRTRKLERTLGEPLFVRSTRSVVMTDFGKRLLPTALELLRMADSIDLLLLDSEEAPARVDVLEEQLAPMTLVRSVMSERARLKVQVSSRRTVENSIRGIINGELDMAFGRIFEGGPDLPEGFRKEIARVEPLVAIVGADHPLRGVERVTPMELARFGIWTPGPGTPNEWTEFLSSFCRAFGIALHVETVSGVDVSQIVSRANPPANSVFVSGMDVLNPDGGGSYLLPVQNPTPVYPWWIIAPPRFERSQAECFYQAFCEVRDSRSWAEIGDECWLAAADYVEVSALVQG